LKIKFLSLIIAFFIKFMGSTLRLRHLNKTRIHHAQALYPIWHSDEIGLAYSYRHTGITILVSLSKDGEILAGAVKRLGFSTVRGSSSRGGQKALFEIFEIIKNGANICFAADGPRGPYHKLKSGMIYVAQKSALPIFPAAAGFKHYFTLRSWDKTKIPIPFTRAVAVYGKPVYVKPEDDIETKRLEVEQSLNKLAEFVDKYAFSKNIGEYLKHHPEPKILIVQPSRLGDIVFTLPALSALRKRYPHAQISWIVDERCAEILQNNPYIDNLIVFDRKNLNLRALKDLKSRLRYEKFDLSIDFHGLFKSAVLVKLANAHFKIASSSTNGMRELSWLFSKEILPKKLPAHCVERHLAPVQHVGCEVDTNNLEYMINISEADFDAVRKKLSELGINEDKIIGMHAGGGWLSRRWGAERYGELAQKLKAELGASIVLVGGKEGGSSEKGLNEEVLAYSNNTVYDLTGKLTIKELCAFLKMVKVFVANEAGPMHIATALNVPSVAILGPTDASRTGPFKGRTKVLQHKVACQPCRNRDCKNVICMQGVSVSMVFDEVVKKYNS